MSDVQYRGPLWGSTGTPVPFTGNISGAQRVTDAHARYMDAVLSGRVFIASSQALATLQTGLTTAQTGLGLFNPQGSGKRAVLWYASCVNLVAQPTAGAVWGLCANTSLIQAVPTSQTAATVRNALLGASQNSTISAFTAGTLAAAPVALSVLGASYTGAITVSTGVAPFSREYAGEIAMEPGSYLGFFCSIAPAASSFWGELIWEEVPILT